MDETNKKIAVIMIRHPIHSNLILHGRRQDNGLFAIPGGHFNPGEAPLRAAYRELLEETGIKPVLMTPRITKTISKGPETLEIHLFEAQCPDDLNLKVGNDPDAEFSSFKFLDPRNHDELHVPKNRNIILEYLDSLES